MTDQMRENLRIFVRRFGLLSASCCETCCGETLSLAQSHILSEIRRLGNPSMQQVAEELGIDITTFSRQAKGLEVKRLIRRSISPTDRRVNLLTLTAEGTRVMGKVDSYLAGELKGILSHMSPFEQQVVTGALGLLNDALALAQTERTGKVAQGK